MTRGIPMLGNLHMDPYGEIWHAPHGDGRNTRGFSDSEGWFVGGFSRWWTHRLQHQCGSLTNMRDRSHWTISKLDTIGIYRLYMWHYVTTYLFKGCSRLVGPLQGHVGAIPKRQNRCMGALLNNAWTYDPSDWQGIPVWKSWPENPCPSISIIFHRKVGNIH